LIGILVGVFVVCCGGGGTALYFIVRAVQKGAEKFGETIQEATETTQSRASLSQIATAVRTYETANGALPNNSYETRPKGSRPLLSWRVHILPQLGEGALYQQFKLDEPWDSPNNIRLLNQMPAVYGSPEARKKAGATKTFFRGFSGPRGIFEKPRVDGDPAPKIKSTDITDGTSSTLLVVDAGTAVEWTKPDDLDFSPGAPRPTFGGAYPSMPIAMVLMADGTIHQIRKDIPDATLRMLIDRADGGVLPVGWEQQ
jgi:hypothetical protein